MCRPKAMGHCDKLAAKAVVQLLRQESTILRFDTPGRGFTEITGEVAAE